MATLQQLKTRLKSVQSARLRIETGAQSATAADLTWAEAQIDKLYKQENDLEKRIARVEGRSPLMTGIDLTNTGY